MCAWEPNLCRPFKMSVSVPLCVYVCERERESPKERHPSLISHPQVMKLNCCRLVSELMTTRDNTFSIIMNFSIKTITRY